MTTTADPTTTALGSISGQFVSGLQHLGRNASPSSLERARERLLDTLSVALAGGSELRERHRKTIRQLCPQGGPVPVFGLARGADLLTAALLNATSAHQLELDDGSRFGMVHPGASVIPALLALGAVEGFSGESLLRGIVVGYEAVIRLAMAMQPGLRQRGFHATGPCGAIGVAMAAAEVLQLNHAERCAALAVAATQAAGLLEVIRDGSDLKPFNAGHAALHGLLAVVMARSGYRPPGDVLGGPQGMLQAFSDSSDTQLLLAIDPLRPAVEMVYVKPYAACRHCHGAIELALALREQHGLTGSDLAGVRVRTYAQGLHLHDHRQVHSSQEARMSTPFSVAVALCTGDAGMASFAEEHLADAAVQQLMERVEMEEDPQRTALVPQQRGTELQLQLVDGSCLIQALPLPLGEPERPLDAAALQAKAEAMLAYAGWSQEAATTLQMAIASLEQDIKPLIACLHHQPTAQQP